MRDGDNRETRETGNQSTDANRQQNEQQKETAERKGPRTGKKENKKATQMRVVEAVGETKTTSQTKEPLCLSERAGVMKANRKTSK